VPAAPPAPPQLLPPGNPTSTSWSPLAGGWDNASLTTTFNTMAMTPPPSDWVIDSGASYHTTPSAGTLSHSHPLRSPHPSSIVVGNGSTLPVALVGVSVLPGLFYLNDVLVAPHITHSLLSVRRFTTGNSCSIEFDPSGFSVKDLATRTPLARCDSSGPLYTFRPSSTGASPPVLVSTTSSTWHRRLGHPGPDVTTKLTSSLHPSCSRGRFEGLYHACQLGRHTHLPFSISSSRAEQAFDLIHCDLWTSPVLSVSGYKYYLVILDDYSHFLWTFPLRLKSDTLPTLTQFFAWVSTQFRRSVCTLQCDNGREFDNHAARSFFLTHGVQLRLSCPYTSAQNGRAERMIRTTTNMICCLLFQASLPATYWAEALHTATHLLNRLPSKATSHPTPTSPCTAQPLPVTTSVCSVVPATLTLLLPHLTSFLLAPLVASSSATPLTTRAIDVWTSPPTASSSIVTSSSTKMCFPLLAPPHPPISTPSSSPIRSPPHPQCLVLRRCQHLVRP
jgi:hypothetical protein